MIIKCKMCGGDILFQPGDTVGQCEYCGSSCTIPKVDEEQKINRYNRANHFRRQSEFDKAIAAYEKILEEDDTDSEAHWGIVLSKYGIEYVEDPVTHERIPTCHRVQPDSILADGDYLAAVKFAPDTLSREIYEAEARRIAEIQKGILSISSQEKPYDVFICYKETEDSGSRTKDSALAQEIYYQLTNEGFKVFFSRITLEDKLGQEYEPYIFAALNSAKVMLVVGTTPEHFNAVWVKNEWSRYLALMRSDRKRILIPCYRDMDPYDLPEEMSSLQSQDMSKIGFMQDIIHGVKKVLEVEKKDSTPTVSLTGPGVASLHKRALLFLEDGDWDSAQEYYDRILDIDPEYAPAYIGKVQIKQRARKETDLARAKEPFTEDPDYQKAVRFANEQQKAIYQGYNRTINERIDRERKESIYREADALEKRAAVENEFLAAAQMFDGAGEIRDAKERAANCRAKAASAKAEAEKAAAVYKEQMERERQERALQEEERRLQEEKRAQEEKLEKEKRARQERIEKEKRAKRNKKVFAVAAVLAVLASGAYFGNEKILQPRLKYNQAEKLLESGEYDQAVSAFTDMEGYGDSAERILEAHYKKGEKLLAEGQLGLAQQSYISAGEYSDARQMASKIGEYYTAGVYLTQQNYADAHAIYAELGDFLDSKQQYNTASQGLYMQLRGSIEKKDFETASVYLAELGDYSDCKTIAAGFDATYDEAMGLWSDGKKTDAEDKLISILGWKDSKEKLPALREEIADDALAASDYPTALKYYTALSADNPEIKNKINETNYRKAKSLLSSDDYDGAQRLFATLEYKDSASLAKQAEADGLYHNGDYAGAWLIYSGLDKGYHTHDTEYAAMYASAEQLRSEGKYDKATAAFASLGAYDDSTSQILETNYQKARSLHTSGDYDEAQKLFVALEYKDSALLAKQAEADRLYHDGDYASAWLIYNELDKEYHTHDAEYAAMYATAEQLRSEGKFDEATVAFALLGTYSDSANQIQETNYQKAKSLHASGDYEEAQKIYSTLEYKDSASLAKQAEADGLYHDDDYAGAWLIYSGLDEAYHSHDTEYAAMYAEAETERTMGNYDAAYNHYKALGSYSDAQQKVIQTGDEKADALLSVGNYREAAEAYSLIGNTEKAQEATYLLAKRLADSGDLQSAAEQFQILDGYKNSSELFVAVSYELINLSMEKKDYAIVWNVYQTLDQTEAIKEQEYQFAQTCSDQGCYEISTAVYESLGQYQLSLSKLPIARYAWADQLFKNGEYEKAAEQFALLGDMTDSAARANESIYQLGSEKLTAKSYDDAKDLFNSIGDYKDASTFAKECDYRKATDLLTEGKNKEAETLFKSLGDYSDSKTKAEESIYNQAEILFAAEKYAEAKLLYDTITYSDSQTKSKQCVYNQAEALFTAGKYADAKPLYDAIDYSDSQTKSKQCVYNQAEALFGAKKYNDASKMYDSIDYLDSKDKAKLSTYQEADTYYSGNKFSEAEVIFLSLKDYSDSADRAKDCHLQQGIVLMDAEDYRGALKFFETVEYENSADLAAKCHYELGRISHLAGKTDEAVAEYAYAVSLLEARSALLSVAKDYSVINETEKAIQTLWLIRDQEDAQNELAKVAATAIQNGKTDLALLAYSVFEKYPEIDCVDSFKDISYESIKTLVGNCSLLADELEFKEYTTYHFAAIARDCGLYDVSAQAYYDLGKYSDATTQLNETYYLKASAKEANGDQEGAYAIFIWLGEYRDSFERANKPYYDLGVAKKETSEWDAAVTAFEHAGSYRDAPTQIVATRYAEGEAKRAVLDWDGAVKAFTEAGTYNDASNQVNEVHYQHALYLLSLPEKTNKNYEEAYKAFVQIQNYSHYKDVGAILANTPELLKIKWNELFKHGNTVRFGTFEQDNNTKNGKEPIEWIVLTTIDGQALLLSKKVLTFLEYHSTTKDKSMRWYNCDLKKWLNKEFLKSFTKAEQNIMLNKHDGKVFLLNKPEAEQFIPNENDRICQATDYAVKHKHTDIIVSQRGSYWWLRDSYYHSGSWYSGMNAYYVTGFGSFNYGDVDRDYGVRPAIWIDYSIGPTSDWVKSEKTAVK